MKQILLTAALLMATACGAQKTTKLPAPNMKRQTTTVMEAYKQRRSQRTFNQKELSRQDLADLLWTAQGVNREDGRLTMPSCMNWQEIRLYLFDRKGVSLYDPKTHSLQEVAQGENLGEVRYEICGESGPEHDKIFEVRVFVGADKTIPK